MRHIELNSQGEAVRQFFLSLPSDPDGSTIALDGRPVARVFPATENDNGAEADDSPWTESKNQRRCDLVDKEIEGCLTAEEAMELASLERQIDRHLRHVAPLPLEEVRRLHDQLLAKAEAARRQ